MRRERGIFHERQIWLREPCLTVKTSPKNVKTRTNGKVHSRGELLAAQERALERTRKMTAREGFESLVRAGIYTRAGKVTPSYGG